MANKNPRISKILPSESVKPPSDVTRHEPAGSSEPNGPYAFSDIILSGDAKAQLGDTITHHYYDQDLRSIYEWLKPSDVHVNHNRLSSVRQPGTALWFLHSVEYSRWLEQNNSLLWLYGGPGTGKSVLCSAAIDDIRKRREFDSNVGLAFFYFTFSNASKQDSVVMMRALLAQLSQQDRRTLVELGHLMDDYQRGTPPDASWQTLLRDAIMRLGTVYIVLDALDECNAHDARQQLLRIVTIFKSWQCQGLHMLVSSRAMEDIRATLEPVADLQIEIDNASVNNDIAQYINSHLENDLRLRRLSADLKDQIASELMRRANGMFLYVSLQLNVIRRCTSAAQIKERLTSMPESLFEVYDRSISQIDEYLIEEASRMLMMLCFAPRPLRVTEVIDALAIELGELSRFDPDRRLLDPKDVRTICPGFVSIEMHESDGNFTATDQILPDRPHVEDEGGDDDTIAAWRIAYNIQDNNSQIPVLRLAHVSVKEYLLSDNRSHRRAASFAFNERDAHGKICKACLVYLHNPSMSDTNIDVIETQYPFSRYAATHWPDHYRLSHTGIHRKGSPTSNALVSEIEKLAIELFLENKTAYATMVRLYNPDYSNMEWLVKTSPQLISPIYYVATLDLVELLLLLIEHADVTSGSSTKTEILLPDGVTQLSSAITAGTRSSMVNESGGTFGNALQAASALGHTKIVEHLLDYGANVNKVGGLYDTALIAAAAGGWEDVVKLLLKGGADINIRGRLGTAIAIAAKKGYRTVVKDLAMGGPRSTKGLPNNGGALHVAAWNGEMQVVRMLLMLKAEVDETSELGETPLFRAAAQGHEEIVTLLLESGADPLRLTRYGRSAANAATWKGHRKVVDLLATHESMRAGQDKGTASYIGHD